MPHSKKLQNQIANKLEKLSKLLDKIDEVRVINSDDSETWDSDVLYNLVATLKETLLLLEDKEYPKQRNEFGEPIFSEKGLCSLLDEYQADEEEIHDD